MDHTSIPTHTPIGTPLIRFAFWTNIKSHLALSLSGEGTVMAAGQGKLGETAASDAVTNSSLGYSVFRRRLFYTEAREHLMRQLYRSVSRNLLRLAKDNPEYLTTLSVLLISDRHWWFATLGNHHLFLYRQDTLQKLYPVDKTAVRSPVQFMGTSKFVEPKLQIRGDVKQGDLYILSSQDLALTINEIKIAELLLKWKTSRGLLEDIGRTFTEEAMNRRKSGEYAVAIAEKI